MVGPFPGLSRRFESGSGGIGTGLREHKDMTTADVDRHFTRVAARYQAVRMTDQEPIREIVGWLRPGASRGLEVGCGTGRYTELLGHHLGAGSSIVAVDACQAMIAMLRPTADPDLGITRVCGNAATLPVRDACFDFVATFNAIHHFDLEAFLAEAARILRPGGRLLIYTRTREQNARSIWGRRFPGFRDKETRLYSRDRLEQAIGDTPGLTPTGIRELAFSRQATVATLKDRVQAHAYSTFALYRDDELTEALTRFVDSIPDPTNWVDENTLVVGQRR